MPIRLLVSAIALIAAAGSTVAAQQASPGDAAKAFTLDSLTPGPTPTASSTRADPTTSVAADPAVTAAPAPVLASPAIPETAAVAAPAAAASPAIRGVFTLDTPIQDLIADAGAKAVLDRDLPGMSDDENLDKFKMLSLRSLQPQTGGQLTDAMLTKVAADLVVLGGGSDIAAPAAIKAGNSKRNADISR